MRGITLTLVLVVFCLSPLTLLAKRLVITPVDVTVEEGASAEFTVTLSSAPRGDVTITVIRPNGTDPSLDKTSLGFTPTNWGAPQQVTMMVGEDADFADDADWLILIASGGVYGGGGTLDTDPAFPHSSGSVGVWGFDFRDSTMISPTYHNDFVGYRCDQGWLSDYVYEDVIDYRESAKAKRDQPSADASHESDMLVLWRSAQSGEFRIEPLFSASLPSQLLEVDGPFHLEGFGGDAILFSFSFTPGQDRFSNEGSAFLQFLLSRAWRSHWTVSSSLDLKEVWPSSRTTSGHCQFSGMRALGRSVVSSATGKATFPPHCDNLAIAASSHPRD